jgi:hypothetical protein
VPCCVPTSVQLISVTGDAEWSMTQIGNVDRPPGLGHFILQCGTVRHGAARCGTVQHGAAPCGTVRHGAARHGAARCSTVQHGAAPCGTVWHLVAQCGAVRHGANEGQAVSDPDAS